MTTRTWPKHTHTFAGKEYSVLITLLVSVILLALHEGNNLINLLFVVSNKPIMASVALIGLNGLNEGCKACIHEKLATEREKCEKP